MLRDSLWRLGNVKASQEGRLILDLTAFQHSIINRPAPDVEGLIIRVELPMSTQMFITTVRSIPPSPAP